MLRSRWPHGVRFFYQAGDYKTDARKFISFIGIIILSVLLGIFWLMFAAKGATYAAVELSAFDVLVLPNEVVIEWQTVSEMDTFGFEVWFKEETASQSAYKLIEKRIAQGALERGVLYRMSVTHLLKRETAYCFQLRELRIDGERGEILVRCGYGLGISAQPTPTPTAFFTSTTEIITPTVPLTTTGSVTMTGPVTDTMSPTMTSPTDPFATPGITNQGEMGLPPTPFPENQGQSPLPTPFMGAQGIQQPPLPDGQTQSPLPTPTPPFTATDPGAHSTDTINTAAVNAPLDPFSQTTGVTTTDATVADPALAAMPLVDPAAQLPTPVGDPPYIVLTATPTSAAVASLPTFTPYPTGMPPSAANLVGLRVPDTQNLMIMLLCGIFSGASGLGVLGLVSTLLYMRSRRQSRTSQRRQ